MDPELLKALREYLAAKQRVTAAGESITPEHEEEFFRVKTGGRFGMADAQKLLASVNTDIGPRNLGRSVAQGATADFADEIIGMLPGPGKFASSPMLAGLGKIFGGGEDAKEEMRLRQDLFRDQHPVADGIAGVAGGVATGLMLPGPGAATLGRTVARGAAIGAGAGAAYGLGRGEGSFEDRGPGAVVPALGGAVLGAAIPGLVGYAKSLTPSARALRRVNHAVEQSGGVEAVRGQNADMDLAGRGQHAMLADLTDRLRLEGDFAVNNSDDILARVAPEVMSRQKNASARLLNDAADVLGESPNAPARAKALKLEVQKFGKEGYTPLRDANPTVPLKPETVKVLGQPVVSAAFKKARETGMIGDTPDMGRPSFQHLQDMKETLDDAVSKAFRDGHGNLGTRLGEARDAIVAELQRVPGYAEISAGYGAKKATEKALVNGMKAWNVEDPNELAKAVEAMKPEALEQFRYGLASKMVSKLQNVRTNRDAAKEIMDRSESMDGKLKLVFGTEENYNRYLFRVEQEAKLAKAKGMFGNSATARRLQGAGFDPIEMGLSTAEGGMPGPAGVLSKLYSMARAPMDRKTAATVGNLVTTKGTKNIDDLLYMLSNPEPLLGRVSGRALPAASGGLLKP